MNAYNVQPYEWMAIGFVIGALVVLVMAFFVIFAEGVKEFKTEYSMDEADNNLP